MKKTMKIVIMLLIVLTFFAFTTNVFAAEVSFSDLTPSYAEDDGGLTNKAKSIMGLIRNVAIIASVIIIMILGVKFMLGSVEEKAEYKKSFMPLIIGIVLVVAATSIASFIFNMAG